MIGPKGHDPLDVTQRLRRALMRARMRCVAVAAMDAALVATAAASGASLVTVIAFWAGVPSTASVSERSLATFCLVFIAAYAASLTWSLSRLPSLSRLANLCDRRFRLCERVATSLEIGHRPAHLRSLVEEALIEDVGPYVDQLRPNQVVPFRLPSWAWVVPVLAGTAVAGHLVASPVVPVVGPTVPVARPDAPSPVVPSESVQRIATALSRDPMSDDDAYLGALAREFEDFAERLENANPGDPHLRQELDLLLDHLARATESREDAVGRLLNELATSDLRAPEADGMAEAEEGLRATAGEIGESTTSGPETLDLFDGSTEGNQVSDLLEALEEAVEAMGEAGPGQPGLAGPRLDCDLEQFMYTGTCDAEGEAADRQTGFVQEGDAAGAPAGAARTSDDRAGDAAGDGGQAADLAEPTSDPGPFESGFEQVRLPEGAVDSNGEHYEVEGVPSRDVAERSDIVVEHALATHRVGEAGIPRNSLGSNYQEIVSRYFLPDSMEAASPSVRKGEAR